jgi:hypothetical protein
MDWTNNFDQFLRQISDYQRLALNTLTSATSNAQSFNPFNLSNNFSKTLKFQEETIKNSLEFQSQVAHITAESQKQLWEEYFNVLRKAQNNVFK